MCVPRSIENEIAATPVSFGFNTALSFTIEMVDRARQAAQSARKIAVVEVLGEHAGWLALQAGIAAGADAVLIPEIPCDPKAVAASLKEKITPWRPFGLVVVAEGTTFVDQAESEAVWRHRLSRLRCRRWRQVSRPVSTSFGARDMPPKRWRHQLQLLIAEETFPLVVGPWARGGPPTAVDRQLGLAYGAGAVRAIEAGKYGVVLAFVPPEMRLVPLADAINKIRTVPPDSEFIQIARSLGICLGRAL